ncbi:MAG: hypothetical protein BWY45_00608 [Euryarchaeota archaeon ADurb.Bin294]|nr:MAG: hypothetical protein BWY45_00608 [Euryarchaeota archaeon ADurb.Bin294]
MPVPDNNGSDHIPHIVFALVHKVLSRFYIPGEIKVTFNTVFTTLLMHPVKFCTDVLPACSDQDIAFQIKDGDPHMSQGVKIVHECLELMTVDNIGKFLFADVMLRSENCLQF